MVKQDCVVCSKYRHVYHIPRAQGCHESSVRCSHCKVHLCAHNNLQCFQKYHTLVELWWWFVIALLYSYLTQLYRVYTISVFF